MPSPRDLAPGRHHFAGGLWFIKSKTGRASWVFRYSHGGKRHEMGLGPYPTIKVTDARRLRDKWAFVLATGGDPIRERQKEREEEMRGRHLFRDVAAQAYESRKPSLRGAGKAGRWWSPLKNHVLPEIGAIPVDEITQRDIERALRPIWQQKQATARKALSRIGIVMKYAAALGLTVDLNAVAAAKELLGQQVDRATHIEAMPWQDVPAFYAKLSDSDVDRALKLLILTGARSKPVRFASRSQISGTTWTIPASLMKGRAGKTSDFRIPLSTEAMRVISAGAPSPSVDGADSLLFKAIRGKALPDYALSRRMTELGETARPHGFRTSLRVWANDQGADYTVAETLLAHSVGTKAARAYLRTDHLEARAELLESWAKHIIGGA